MLCFTIFSRSLSLSLSFSAEIPNVKPRFLKVAFCRISCFSEFPGTPVSLRCLGFPSFHVFWESLAPPIFSDVLFFEYYVFPEFPSTNAFLKSPVFDGSLFEYCLDVPLFLNAPLNFRLFCFFSGIPLQSVRMSCFS